MIDNKIIITSGEPAGVGVDIICLLYQQSFFTKIIKQNSLPIIIIDKNLLIRRLNLHNIKPNIEEVEPNNLQNLTNIDNNKLYYIHLPAIDIKTIGQTNPKNSTYVLKQIKLGTKLCLNNKVNAIITGPINKQAINKYGIPFSGHTEYLQKLTKVKQVVMVLANSKIKMALATTHIPLSQVPQVITKDKLTNILQIIFKDAKNYWHDLKNIIVLGLNPHAGENGYLGNEEKKINVLLSDIQKQVKLEIIGTLPADTFFLHPKFSKDSLILAMYHDQGLPIIKYSDFNRTVNLTLGLPIIRTSVAHGTALNLAGTQKINLNSMKTAIEYAITFSKNRMN